MFLDGKLRWSGSKKKFTNVMWLFFRELADHKEHIKSQREYLRIDYVWHYENDSRHLELAVEHENRFEFNKFLSEEIRSLIDVKACNKVAITYPQASEEKLLIEKIRKMIEKSAKLDKPEEYLVILGFPTTKRENGRRKRAILLKAYYLTQNGEISKTDERVILQGKKTHTLKIEAVDEKGRPLRIPFKIEYLGPPGRD
jgi:hypothetical protein